MSASGGPHCPFCDSSQAELVSPFGGQIITSQFRCRACQTYFEAIREDFEPARQPEPEPRPNG